MVYDRLPSKQTAGATFTLVHAALTVCLQWTHLAAVTAAAAECLSTVLRHILTALMPLSTIMQAPECMQLN